MLDDGNILLTRTAQTGDQIIRLTPAGAIDTTFDPGTNRHVVAFGVKTDGDVLLGVNLATVSGDTGSYVAQISPSTLDVATWSSALNASMNVSVYLDSLGALATTGGEDRDEGYVIAYGTVTQDNGHGPNDRIWFYLNTTTSRC